MKLLYTTVKDGRFYLPLSGLQIDLTGTSLEYPKAIEDHIANRFLKTRCILEVVPEEPKEKVVVVEPEVIIPEEKSKYEGTKRNVLYAMARERGWMMNYTKSSIKTLIKFLEGEE